MDPWRWAAGALAVLVMTGTALVSGLPGRLVWGDRPGDPAHARDEEEAPLRSAPATAVPPVPVRYAPGWLPGGLRETWRSASVYGGGSTSVTRVWMPAGSAAPWEGLHSALGEAREPERPALSVHVDYRPDPLGPARPLREADGGPLGPDAPPGYSWRPEAGVAIVVSQQGLDLDLATLYRVARSVHPVADEFTFPLQARRLPAGLTETSWDWSVMAVVGPDGAGGWRGSVNWCLGFEITVDGDGPPEAVASRWQRLHPGGVFWYGVRRLDDELSKTVLAVEKRPGTVVTVSLMHGTGRRVAAAELARIAAAVEVPA
jgi:hypothetical protein